MDSSDGNGDVGGGGDGLSPRGSKRPATEESSPGEKGVVAAHDNNINRAATTAAEREYNKVQEHQEGGRREEHGGEEKQSNLDADGRDQEGDVAAMRGDLEFCKRKEVSVVCFCLLLFFGSVFFLIRRYRFRQYSSIILYDIIRTHV